VSDVVQEQRRQALIAEIEAAFTDVRLGDGVSLHQARALDDYWSHEEAAAARRHDREERWRDISDEKVRNFNDTLTFMDAAGFRFHLPRFMVFALENPTDEMPVCLFSICALKRRDDGKFRLLNDEQRRAINHFLRHVMKYGDFFDKEQARDAIRAYWRLKPEK